MAPPMLSILSKEPELFVLNCSIPKMVFRVVYSFLGYGCIRYHVNRISCKVCVPSYKRDISNFYRIVKSVLVLILY